MGLRDLFRKKGRAGAPQAETPPAEQGCQVFPVRPVGATVAPRRAARTKGRARRAPAAPLPQHLRIVEGSQRAKLLRALCRGRELSNATARRLVGSPYGDRRLNEVRQALAWLEIPCQLRIVKPAKGRAGSGPHAPKAVKLSTRSAARALRLLEKRK